MESTLAATPPPPAASAQTSSTPSATSSQPSDNKEEFPKLLAGARDSVETGGGPDEPGRPRPAVAPGPPPAGKGLPAAAAPGLPVHAVVADARDSDFDSAGEDGGDLLLSWTDIFSLDVAPIGVPPQPMQAVPLAAAAPSQTESFTPGYTGAPEFGGPASGAPEFTAEQGDAMAPLLLAANAMRLNRERNTAEPHDPAPLSTPASEVGGLHSSAAAPPSASRAGTAPPSGQPPGSLEQPLGQPGWGRELGSRVLWLAKDKLQYAELRLNPPHLGPLDVHITLQDQGASLSFLSNHAAVRDAVASALPQLREMLADGGFIMLDVNVSHHSAGSEHSRTAHREASGSRAIGAQEVADGAANDDEGRRRSLQPQGAGLVDYFV